jgi:hypothetical protein
VNWIVSQTVQTSGVSKTSVFKVRSKSAWGLLVTTSKKRQSKGVHRNSRKMKYDGVIIKAFNFIFGTHHKPQSQFWLQLTKVLTFQIFWKFTLLVLMKEIEKKKV